MFSNQVMAHKINAKDAKDASLLLYTQNLTTEKPQRGDINIAWGNALGNPFYADGLIWGP